MSKLLIQNYLAELSKLRQIGGTHRVSVDTQATVNAMKDAAR